MGFRRAGLIRVGFRRVGNGGGSGLPYEAPLVPDAVVWINDAGTKATTSTQLLYKDPGTGSKTLAVLETATALLPADDGFLVVKHASGRVAVIVDGGLTAPNVIELRNGGGGSRDQVVSSSVQGLQIGTNAGGGLTNTGITLDPGTAGNAFLTVTTDQVQVNCSKWGVFSTTPVSQFVRTTAGPAGGTYNATAQTMLNNCFSALRAYGLLSP